MKSFNASISIYFVFSIVLIISVIFSVTEMARYNCQKLYLQIATDTSVDSMLSLYHRKLYDYYSLYGVEYRTNEMLETEFLSYMKPYFIDEENNIKINNWYTADINEENINLTTKLLIDDNNFEKEILNYIKYAVIGKTIKYLGKNITINEECDKQEMLDNTKEIFDDVSQSKVYSEIYSKYFNFAADIKILENYAKKIKDYINIVNLESNLCKSINTGGSLSNGKGVLTKFNNLSESAINLIQNLTSYQNKMNDFRKIVEDSERKFNDDLSSGLYDFSDDIKDFIESEFNQFKSFVDENSEMNKNVENKKIDAKEFKDVVDGHIANIKTYVDELTELDEALKEASSVPREDRDNELIRDIKKDIKDLQKDFSDYLIELKADVSELHMNGIELDASITNHAYEENLLDNLINYKNGILLNMVLDNNAISAINTIEQRYNSFNIISDNQNVSLNKILIGEYILDKFNYYNRQLNGDLPKSNSTSLEVERVLNGKFSDMDNLKATIDQILLIRIAMNVLYIYKSNEKRRIAREFAYTLFAGFSRILAEVMFLVIISAWGTVQSIVDIKRLLKNYNVKFMHDDESFSVDINEILSYAMGHGIGIRESDDSGIALSYKDYLRLLLLNTNQSDENARMISIMESNLKKEQENFDYEKLIYSFDVNNRFTCNHFFTNNLFVGAKSIKLYDEYYINTSAYKSFYP